MSSTRSEREASRWHRPGKSGWLMSCGADRSQGKAIASIASIAAWRFDGGQLVEIEVDDCLQGVGGGGILEAGRQRGKPSGILGLQCEEFACRGTLAPWTPPPPRRR